MLFSPMTTQEYDNAACTENADTAAPIKRTAGRLVLHYCHAREALGRHWIGSD